MIHVTTGNRVDVVYDYENGIPVFRGIQPWGEKLIPLPDPQALAEAIQQVMREIRGETKPAKKGKR